MVAIPEKLHQDLLAFGQKHVLDFWNQLNDAERNELLGQLQELDLAQLRRLYAGRDKTFVVPAPERIAPVPVQHLDPADGAPRSLGENALRRGEVAVLVVAGGQGSRPAPAGLSRPAPESGRSPGRSGQPP